MRKSTYIRGRVLSHHLSRRDLLPVELGIGVGSAEEIELQSDNVPEMEEIRSHLMA